MDWLSSLYRWREQRRCFHGAPGGLSFVSALYHVDWGRKVWQCSTQKGGCGKRWVL